MKMCIRDSSLLLTAFPSLRDGDKRVLKALCSRLRFQLRRRAERPQRPARHHRDAVGERLGLFQIAVSYTHLLCADGVTDEDRGAGVFSHVKKTVAALQKLCARLGVACETDTASIPCKRFARPDGDLAAVERGLFDYTCEPRAVETDGSVALYEAESLYTECEAAAARAKALIAQGLRLREIAVVTRDMESYGRTAEAVFRKYGLPVFLDQRSDAAQKLPVRLLCAALDIAANGCSLNRMLRLVKTGLSGVSPAEADELERYALMWNRCV